MLLINDIVTIVLIGNFECRELIFHTNYLGSDQPSVTLNFSKGASNIIAQYYMVNSSRIRLCSCTSSTSSVRLSVACEILLPTSNLYEYQLVHED